MTPWKDSLDDSLYSNCLMLFPQAKTIESATGLTKRFDCLRMSPFASQGLSVHTTPLEYIYEENAVDHTGMSGCPDTGP